MPPPCVLCGQHPAATKEHIFPAWVRRGIHATGPTTITTLEGVRKTTGLTWLVRDAVCRECNNGWMSKVESAVKPYLLPAMRGWPIVLDPPTQRLVAAWAVKTALMFELKVLQDGQHRGLAPASNLHWLYDHRDALLPPPGSQVWIAGVNAELGTANSHVGWHSASVVDTATDTEFYFATFSVGYLVFQVFGTDFGEADPDAWASAPRWSMVRSDHLLEAIRSIWPARSEAITWPPSLGLTIDDMSSFHGADDARLFRLTRVPIRKIGATAAESADSTAT